MRAPRLVRRTPRAPELRLAALREDLLSNLRDDLWYADFPRVPKGPCTERRTLGPWQITHLLCPPTRSQVVVVRCAGAWLGSLRHDPATADISWTLPESSQATLDRLLDALGDIAERDAASRRGAT